MIFMSPNASGKHKIGLLTY